MNAEQAKKQAKTNREKHLVLLDKEKKHKLDTNAAVLLNHFQSKIKEAVNKGNMSTEEMKFPIDRFSDDVIREVNDALKKDGFNLSMTKHNAYQQVSFVVSWV